MTNSSKCAVCGVSASLKCMACKQVFYCGKEHQKIHWKKGHKAECKCYEIARNDVLGRHLRASRDIKCGEIILRESPLIYGPKVASAPLCLGCHRTLSTPVGGSNFYKCRKCSWPLCGPDCEHSQHHLHECQLMASRNFRAKIDYSGQVGKKESAYCVILPLRCLLMKASQPADFERFSELEDHLNERKDTPLYNVLRANLVTFVKTILGMHESEEEVLRVAAILDTNAFEIRQNNLGRKVRAIYPSASMFSHDCISNSRHTFDDNMQIVFIAKTPIAKGDIISTSYTQPLWSTIMRRSHLLQAKCFECTCRRCLDPTELNTFTGAITCSRCKVGKIISTNPMDNSAIWKCQLCPHKLSAKQINLGNQAIQNEIDSLDKTSAKAFEEFLFRYRDTLHEKNTHILQVKYALTQLYDFSMIEHNDAALKRKLELCQELLEIAELLDGGWSIFRGNLILDLQEAMVVQAKREFLNGLLTREATQEKLLESMNLLKEALEIMKLEPDMKQMLNERTQLLAKELEMEDS
ncbi:SET domain-containing protein SmydA-8 [Stomoxys calcitrans]|uniref:MYND-type domain-containing protein n=1 Tax=Stomoxys calcitrans TaxID=35570 RepID=A0A1I8QBJ0_STOCA|nr:SET domain-containing protein SmydA-8 [Stomoxys calcitrans]